MALSRLKRDSYGELTENIIGTSASPTTLTDTYAGNSVTLATAVFSVLIIYAFYTPGDDDRNMSIQVEGSADGTNFAQKVIFKDEVSGESTMLGHVAKVNGVTNGEQYARRYVIKVADNFIKVSIKEDGSSNFGTAFIQATAQLTR